MSPLTSPPRSGACKEVEGMNCSSSFILCYGCYTTWSRMDLMLLPHINWEMRDPWSDFLCVTKNLVVLITPHPQIKWGLNLLCRADWDLGERRNFVTLCCTTGYQELSYDHCLPLCDWICKYLTLFSCTVQDKIILNPSIMPKGRWNLWQKNLSKQRYSFCILLPKHFSYISHLKKWHSRKEFPCILLSLPNPTKRDLLRSSLPCRFCFSSELK